MKEAVVIVDPDIRINQQIALGFSEELQKHDEWDVHVLSRTLPVKDQKRGIREIGAAAVAVRCPNAHLVSFLENESIPFVIVAHEGFHSENVSAAIPDTEAAGAMAAKYLLSLNFVSFAAVGYEEAADPRIEVFCQAIRHERNAVYKHSLQLESVVDHPFGSYGNPQKLIQWLHDLPKPCAIFAHSDQPGAYLIRTCIHNGIRVPEEISVVGVDDDPLFCHTVMPNLASVHVPNARIGIEAARMILDWKPGRRLVKVPPTTVVERASCRPPTRRDPLVDMAMDHLRKNVAKGVRVRDLQKLTGLSPHQLIYRFNIVTGRTPMELILRNRVAVAKRLLAETITPVSKIATKSGFNSATQFYVTFRNHVGMSPSDYRSQFTP